MQVSYFSLNFCLLILTFICGCCLQQLLLVVFYRCFSISCISSTSFIWKIFCKEDSSPPLIYLFSCLIVIYQCELMDNYVTLCFIVQ